MPIETLEEFKNWLKEQPQETCVLIAARAALRSFPVLTHYLDEENNVILSTARAIIISIVASKVSLPRFWVATNIAASTAYRTSGPAGSISEACEAAAHAARAADHHANADYVADYATRAADYAADAVRYVTEAKNYETTLATIFADAFIEFEELFSEPLWSEQREPDWLSDNLISRKNILDSGPEWAFWREWYQGFLIGKPLDWELQRRVALIDADIWETGPEAVAEEIERIRAEYEKETARGPSGPKPITEAETDTISQHALVNRDALAVSAAGLLEQLADFKERVRGLNHLDTDFREELLEFIEDFSAKLEDMLAQLPQPGERLDTAKAEKLALWLREYKTLMRSKLAHYASPENATEATVPTGIVLAATGIGAMFGSPLAGSVVGGLIANQMKPGQAAKELLKSNKPDADGN